MHQPQRCEGLDGSPRLYGVLTHNVVPTSIFESDIRGLNIKHETDGPDPRYERFFLVDDGFRGDCVRSRDERLVRTEPAW